MAQWGKDDKSITITSGTTAETSTGAPIGTYALVKGAKANSTAHVTASNADFGNTSVGSKASIDKAMFGNDIPGAFISGMAVGVFGVTAAEIANNLTNETPDQPAHAGWVVRRAGTGPVISAVPAATDGSTNFVTGETVRISNGSSNAVLTVTSNSSGNVVSYAVTNGGAGWCNTGMCAKGFIREKHITALTVTAPKYVSAITLHPPKYVSAITVQDANLSYNNNSILVISATDAYLNAQTVQISTNTLGGFTTVALANGGYFPYSETAGALTVAVANAGGGAVQGNAQVVAFTPVLTASPMVGYSNNSIVTLKVTDAYVNAVSAQLSTDGSGTITAVTVANGGYFPATHVAGDLTAAVANAGGGAVQGNSYAVTFVPTLATAAMTGYDNTSIVTVTSSNCTVNAYTANLSTDVSGVITAVTMAGKGVFGNTTAAGDLVYSIVKNTGIAAVGNTVVFPFEFPTLGVSSGGNPTLTLGGRANRVHTETLIATGSLGAQSAAYGTPATANGLSVNSPYYPGL